MNKADTNSYNDFCLSSKLPYAVGIVKLDECIQMMGQITDCDTEELKIGDRLVTQFRRINEESKTGMIMYGFKFVPDLGLENK